MSTSCATLSSPGKAKVKRMLESRNEDELDSIPPVPVSSESELKKELTEIGDLCSDTKNPEWMKRVRALQRFRGLLSGGAHEHHNFLPLMKAHMKEAINLSIQDLRSAVAKEACFVVMHLCKTVPAAMWEAICDWFITALLRITVVTIAIISQSSAKCLRYIFNRGLISHRAVSIILDSSNYENKHSTYRLKVYQLMFCVVRRVTDLSERELDGVARAVKQGLIDPMPEVRRVSRLLYWGLHRVDPGRAEPLLLAIDGSVHRLLLDDEAVFESLSPNDLDLDSLSTVGCTTPSLKGRRKLSTATTGDAETPQLKTRSASAHALSDRVQGVHEKRRPSQPRSLTPVPLKNEEGTVGRPKQEGGLARRASAFAPRTASDALVSEPPTVKPARRSPLHWLHPAPLTSVTSNSEGLSDSLDVSRGNGSSSTTDSTDSPGTVEQALALASASDWTSRVRSFEMLKQLLSSPSQRSLVYDRIGTIMPVLLDKLTDTNIKVQLAAYECCTAIVEQFEYASLDAFLERLFSILFAKLTSAKTNAATVNLLEKLLEHGKTTTLFPVLLKVLDNNNPKQQLGCLEYFIHLLKFAHEYFHSTANMRIAIAKFASLASSTNTDIHKASTMCLTLLHRSQTLVFLEAFLTFPTSEQAAYKSLLGKSAPSIEDELHVLKTHGPDSLAMMLSSRRRKSAPDAGTTIQSPPSPLLKDGKKKATLCLQPVSVKEGSEPKPATTPSPTAYPATGGRSSLSSSGSSSRLHRDPVVGTSPKVGKAVHKARVVEKDKGTLWNELLSPASPESERMHLAKAMKMDLSSYWPPPDLDRVLLLGNGLSLFDAACDDKLSTQHRLVTMELSRIVVGRVARDDPKTPYLRDFFLTMMQCYYDSDPTISDSVEEHLNTLFVEVDPKVAIQLVGTELQKRGTGSQQEEVPLLLKLLERLITHTGVQDRAGLASSTPHFLPALYDGFNSPRTEVRKAVVFCFVALYLALGAEAVPLLKPLSTSQLKLVTIYVNRKRQGHGEVDLSQIKTK